MKSRKTELKEVIMSIEVVIKQKGFFKKDLPMEIILGDDLTYGTYDWGNRIQPKVMGKNGFVVYNESCIGRGISVDWLSKNKKSVYLKVLNPTSENELRNFYAMATRIADYWKCSLEVDGAKLSIQEFNDGFDNMLQFNNRALLKLASEIIEKKSHYVLFSAMYPLSFGVQEAEEVLKDPEFLDRWMNEKQSEEFYYAVPRFYSTPEGIQGVYVCTAGCKGIFPQKPIVPFDITDPKTGKPLECNSYIINFFDPSTLETLGPVSYSEFIDNLDQESVSYFDADHILVEPFSADDIRNFLEKINAME